MPTLDRYSADVGSIGEKFRDLGVLGYNQVFYLFQCCVTETLKRFSLRSERVLEQLIINFSSYQFQLYSIELMD